MDISGEFAATRLEHMGLADPDTGSSAAAVLQHVRRKGRASAWSIERSDPWQTPDKTKGRPSGPIPSFV